MGSDSFILLGVNHKTTPVEIREKIALSGGYEEPLQRLKTISGCRECFLLSTCNRVELLVVGEPGPAMEEHFFLVKPQLQMTVGDTSISIPVLRR